MRRRALLVVAILVCAACKRQEPPVRHDAELKRTLATMRAALESFHKDNARYPKTLDELVPKYLPRVPVDPVTGSAKTWRFSTEETVQPNRDFTTATSAPPQSVIIDVRSGAGAPYSTY